MEAILHGAILAIGLILPLGVQNVFLFTQGAMQPRLRNALPATITAALCDTLLILLAIFGLSLIILQFEWMRVGIMIAGVLFLIYMGYSIWKSEPATSAKGKALSPKKQIVFAMSVSLLNPHAILDIVGVIGTSAMNYIGLDLILFTISCITVSWIWFAGLTISGAIMKRSNNQHTLMSIFNKGSALFIWGTAIYLLTELM